jgi:hypothetical protein
MGKAFIIALVAESVIGVETDNSFYDYISFLANYGRSYANKQHLDERYEIFKENLAKIEKHNSSDPPFLMAVNQFSDLTEPEFLQINTGGARPPRKRLQAVIDPTSDDSWHPAYSLDDYDWPEGVALPAYKNWFEDGFVTRP